MSPTVVVSAGTYHLPFQRLMDWTEKWLTARGESIDVLVQHGPSHPVAGAQNVELLAYDELLELCGQAAVVVLQGGAGGVMDMRSLGLTPLVVPRVPVDGEVVDDHQLVFTKEMESSGLIRRALTYQEFADQLEEMLTKSGGEPQGIETPGTARVGALLSQPIRALPPAQTLSRLFRSAGQIIGAKLRRSRS